MDTSQYHPTGLSNANHAQYMHHHHLQQQHQQQQQQQQQHQPQLPAASHTLPPLQSQHAAMNSLYSNATQAVRSTGTPNTPNGTTNLGTFSSLNPSQNRGGYSMMPVSSYQQGQAYRTNAMAGTSAPQSHLQQQPQQAGQQSQQGAQSLAPASQMHQQQQTLRPAMQGSQQQIMSALSGQYGQSNLMSGAAILHESETPTHVVGSQGRRGILPSAPGRPTVTTTASGAVKPAVIPAKDADGKFPCPHCTKTYLHAKHLKRHLLRHTGDRPYMCVLCKDTFSRSDILKRHFQKCSIRRGNPTGASHLSHASAHIKKHASQKSTSSIASDSTMMGAGAVNNLVHDNSLSYGVVGDHGSGMSHLANDGQVMSRSSSTKADGSAGVSSHPTTTHSSNRSSIDQGHPAGMPSSMSSVLTSALTYNLPHGQTHTGYGQNFDYSPGPNGGHVAVHGMDTNQHAASRASAYHHANNGSAGSVDWSLFPPAVPQNSQGNFLTSYSSGLSNSQISGIK